MISLDPGRHGPYNRYKFVTKIVVGRGSSVGQGLRWQLRRSCSPMPTGGFQWRVPYWAYPAGCGYG